MICMNVIVLHFDKYNLHLLRKTESIITLVLIYVGWHFWIISLQNVAYMNFLMPIHNLVLSSLSLNFKVAFSAFY